MDLSPQPKHRFKNRKPNIIPFPITEIINETDVVDNRKKFIGYFTGVSVDVFDQISINRLYENGCFGVSSKTKAVPLTLLSKSSGQIQKKSSNKCVLTNEETLVLFLEEALFLYYGLKCLSIRNVNDDELTTEQIINIFCKIKPNFITHYITYHYLKSKNWVVKSGLKFGGHFLLYKAGPRQFHASYIVISTKYRPDNELDMNTLDIHGLQRIGETSKKQVMIIEIYYPEEFHESCPPITLLLNLDKFQASDITPLRFNINGDRCTS